MPISFPKYAHQKHCKQLSKLIRHVCRQLVQDQSGYLDFTVVTHLSLLAPAVASHFSKETFLSALASASACFCTAFACLIHTSLSLPALLPHMALATAKSALAISVRAFCLALRVFRYSASASPLARVCAALACSTHTSCAFPFSTSHLRRASL